MAVIVKPNTFSAGATIVAAEHNDNFDTIYDDYNGNVTNSNVSASAAIGNSKLNLASIAQNMTFTGDLTLEGSANDFSAATISDLGIVTTANIDGGTLDGVQVGGTTATGELLVNDSADAANGLGDQGTSGEFLQSAGAGANPVWAAVTSAGFELISVTALSAATVSSDITIAADKYYLVLVDIDHVGGSDAEMSIRVNSDSGATSYAWYSRDTTFSATPSDTLNGDDSDNVLTIVSTVTSLGFLSANFSIDTTAKGGIELQVNGQYTGLNRAGVFAGVWNNGAPTSFEIFSSLANSMTGNVYLYEANLTV